MKFSDISGYIGRSLDNLPGGASAKKLTALVFVLLCVWIHFMFCELSNALEFLIADQATLTALLGVSTVEAMRRKKEPKEKTEAL
jgi:hypothetical protein